MAIDRKIKESPLYQGTDEKIYYTLTTMPWGGSPTSVAVIIKNADGTDVSSTNLLGSASVTGDVITLPQVISLTTGQKYRLEIKFTSAGQIIEAWAEIWGEQ